MQITLKYGLSVYAPSAVAQFGAILSIYLEERKERKYKDVALLLLNESSEKRQGSIVYLVIYTLIDYWFEHISFTIEPLRSAYKMGRESGINDSAFQAAISYCYNSFFIGNQLTHLNEDMKEIRRELPLAYVGFESLNATVEVFLGIHPNDQRFNIDSCAIKSSKVKSTYNLICILRAYYFHEYESAATLIDESKLLYKEFHVGSCHYQYFIFYSGLVALSMAKKEERFYWLQIATEHISLIRLWSNVVPENFENKQALLEAEMSAVLGKKDEAKRLFEKAIYLSEKHCFINEAALSNERAGIFCIESNSSCNSSENPSPFLSKALELYAKWEADAKVRHINSLYSAYISQNPNTSEGDAQVLLNNLEVRPDLCSEISDELSLFSL